MSDNSLPDSIIESIAISNANSIGEQPAILANMALANQIFNNNVQQQIILVQQQVMNQLMLATLARCVSLITTSFPGTADAREITSALEGLSKCLESARQMAADGNALANGSSSSAGGTHPSFSAGDLAAAKPGKPDAVSKPANGLPPELVEQIAAGNLKAVSEQPAMLSNLAYLNTVTNTNLAAQNAVAAQQAMNELGISILGKTTNVVSNLGPVEAKSAQEILSGNTMAEVLVDLKVAIENLSRGNR